MTEERANRIKLVHKILGDLTRLLLPVFYLISAYQNNFKGNLNLGKITVKLANDGKEPAAHSLMLQYRQFKIISVPKPSHTRQ